MAVLYALITAVAFTVTNIYVRLAAKGEKDIAGLSVSYGLLGGLFALPLIFLDGKVSIESHPNTLFVFAAIVAWAISGYLLIWVSGKLNASINALLSQTTTIFSFILGIVLFTGSSSWLKLLGVILIVLGNSFLFIGRARLKFDKVFLVRMLLSLTFALAYLFDNIASLHFSSGLYIAIAYAAPALLVMVVGRVSVKNLLALYKRSPFNIFMISLSSIVGYYFLVKAYEFDNVSLVVPISYASSILTVIASGIFLGEKDSLLKKIILGVVVFVGVVIMGLS